MSKSMMVKAIRTPEEFAEHIRAVEEFIAYEDPPTKLMDAIGSKFVDGKIAELSEAQIVYFALNEFVSAVFNGYVADFFDVAPDIMQEAVADGFTTIGEEDLAAGYRALRQLAVDKALPENAEEMDDLTSPFTDDYFELIHQFDGYAQEQGLLS